MTLISITSVICATLFTLLGAFSILTNKGNKTANVLLGLFFLLWAVDFLDGLLLLNRFYIKHPGYALWGDALVFLYGPLLYLHTVQITENRKLISRKFFLHFIPFFIMLAVIFVSFQVLPREEKKALLNTILELNQPSYLFLIIVLIYLHFFSYIYFSKKQIRKAENTLNDYYSNYNLSWLNTILNAFLIILTLSVITSVLQFQQPKIYLEIGLPLLIVVMALFASSAIIKGLNSPLITIHEGDVVKYAGSKLSPNEIKSVSAKIIQGLEKDKLYLNPELTLKDLSEAIDVNSRNVSQVINAVFHRSFFDLINSHRIEAAKEIFKTSKDPKLTILEVMYTVGFNSKSSFNTSFKNKTGLTPSEFKKLN